MFHQTTAGSRLLNAATAPLPYDGLIDDADLHLLPMGLHVLASRITSRAERTAFFASALAHCAAHVASIEVGYGRRRYKSNLSVAVAGPSGCGKAGVTDAFPLADAAQRRTVEESNARIDDWEAKNEAGLADGPRPAPEDFLLPPDITDAALMEAMSAMRGGGAS